MLCERGKDRRTGRREETEREMRGAVVTGLGRGRLQRFRLCWSGEPPVLSPHLQLGTGTGADQDASNRLGSGLGLLGSSGSRSWVWISRLGSFLVAFSSRLSVDHLHVHVAGRRLPCERTLAVTFGR